jgi:hypothetical protein
MVIDEVRLPAGRHRELLRFVDLARRDVEDLVTFLPPMDHMPALRAGGRAMVRIMLVEVVVHPPAPLEGGRFISFETFGPIDLVDD